ncbi:hypothetical protein [Olsenella urininfantis]|uniref:hypothetical protein n=1 Tax=Olsenella urininfantis TaxID=1871033 RepID=UPI000987053F|nr:hypothetical protein [Olsenella urininfantis]
MKFGIRKPSIKKSISARTKGKVTRKVKKAVVPGYGKRGMGWLHPKRKVQSAIYERTTVSAWDLLRKAFK